MLLEQVKNIKYTDEDLAAEIEELSEAISSVLLQLNEELGMTAPGSNIRMPAPGEADAGAGEGEYDQPEDLVSAMEVIIKQMDAAKRGMAILNKMADSPSRTRNKSRVMANLNKIRGSLDRVFKKMKTMADSGNYETNPAY